MTSNVYSNTHRLGVINVGHRGPRNRKGRRQSKTTRTALCLIRDCLEYIGDTTLQQMKEYVGIDQTRLDSLRNHLVRLGAVRLEKRGRATYWVLLHPERIDYDFVLANVALEPRWAKSNTDPTKSQIDCTLCGLQTRAWVLEDRARAWREHLGSVCHR